MAGVYYSRDEAEQAVIIARYAGIPADKIMVLTPGDIRGKGVLSRLLGGEDPVLTREQRTESKAAGPFERMPSFAAHYTRGGGGDRSWIAWGGIAGHGR